MSWILKSQTGSELSSHAISLDLASVQLRLPVVADAHEEDVASVFGNLSGILLALNLVDGSVGSVVEFQFYDDGRLADVAARNHHQVGISLASGLLAVDDIFISCPDICHGDDTSQGVLVVVGEDACVFVVSQVDGLSHCILITRDGGIEEEF